MQAKEKKTGTIWKSASNYLFIALMLFVVVNADAKAWLLRQMMSIGLFKGEINEAATTANESVTNTSFYYADAGGNTLSTEALRGKVVFINFWATWCPPCRAEMPSLDALYRKLRNDGRFVFLFMSEDDNLQKAKDYLQDKGYLLPLTSRAGAISQQVFSGTLPTTIVLDKEGKIVMKEEGVANYNTEAFISQLKALL